MMPHNGLSQRCFGMPQYRQDLLARNAGEPIKKVLYTCAGRANRSNVERRSSFANRSLSKTNVANMSALRVEIGKSE